MESPSETKVCFFRNRQEEFQDFYSEENGLVYCNNIWAVMDVLDHEHKTTEWRLLIDSSKTSLKTVFAQWEQISFCANSLRN